MVKKLAIAPLFLICLAILCYQLNPFLTSTDSIFSLSLDAFLSLITLTSLTLLSSLLFVLFATLAQDWKLVGGIIVAAGIIPVALLPSNFSLYMASGVVLSLVLIFALLLNKLKTYINFQPSVLLSPSIRNLATLLAFIISFLYFQSLSTAINQKGFEIPDSLVDSTLKLADPTGLGDQLTDQSEPLLSSDDIDLLKRNPQLLRERGIDPKILEQIENPKTTPKDTIKDLAKTRIQNMLKPYEGFIAPTMAILLFFTLTSLISLMSLIIPILLWLTFSILKSTGFIKFQTEMREVKKLVV